MKDKQQHTPAPWDGDIRDEILNPAMPATEYEANEALCRAAPELLDAMKYVRGFFSSTRHGRHWIEQGGDELDRIDAAIEAATE